uniref:Calcineurin-like phosphoesterase domain-containing protein n=1 Tax=Coccolithus braarudii TaxID=221442 RepID=A0A7S0LGX2_9EUKA|mmetsp:Transcript_39816/g.84886  ORF Transcript_39816/g.84886 Transcript_39816/m.84886 type:complete len:577 (+) Transcript_39816:64-1794(+)
MVVALPPREQLIVPLAAALGGALIATLSSKLITNISGQLHHRRLQVPSQVLQLCKECLGSDGGHMEKSRRQEWLIHIAPAAPLIPIEIWVAYRMWIDEHSQEIDGSTPSALHRFLVALAFGIDASKEVNGTEAADLIACLAGAGLLGNETSKCPVRALKTWLQEGLAAFNSRFRQAHDNVFTGLGPSEESVWCGDYFFIQLADPQIGMLHMDKSWAEEAAMLGEAVRLVNKLKPRFLLISGDLTNAYPSPKTMKTVEEQTSAFKSALSALDPSIPLVLQPGNHDVGQRISPAAVQMYQERYGSEFFSFWVGGVLYLAINSQHYAVDGGTSATERAMMEAQDEWLLKQLSSERAKEATHIVVLSHICPFMEEEGESAGYFNWRERPRRKVLDAAEKAGVRLWLCGHLHQNSSSRSHGGIEIVTTSSCASVINWSIPAGQLACATKIDFPSVTLNPAVVCDAWHSGMRIVKVSSDHICHQWVTFNEVPERLEDLFSDGDSSRRSASRPEAILEGFIDHGWGLLREARARGSNRLLELAAAERAKGGTSTGNSQAKMPSSKAKKSASFKSVLHQTTTAK